MTFKVTYNYKPRTFDENGKYVDNDTYTISFNSNETIEITVTREELDQLYDEMKKAIWECNDTRGYHE